MNAKPAGITVTPIIDDVQGRADTRRIPIDRVGIKDIYPPGTGQGPLGRRPAHDRELQHVRVPAP